MIFRPKLLPNDAARQVHSQVHARLRDLLQSDVLCDLNVFDRPLTLAIRSLLGFGENSILRGFRVLASLGNQFPSFLTGRRQLGLVLLQLLCRFVLTSLGFLDHCGD